MATADAEAESAPMPWIGSGDGGASLAARGRVAMSQGSVAVGNSRSALSGATASVATAANERSAAVRGSGLVAGSSGASSAKSAAVPQRRERAGFADMRVRRDRGSLRGRRGRGRGRGSMAAPHERARAQRAQLAKMAAASSGDAHAPSAEIAAAEFERVAAGDSARRSAAAAAAAQQSQARDKRSGGEAGGAKRKSRRTKRMRVVEGKTMRLTARVPIDLLSPEMRKALLVYDDDGEVAGDAVSTRKFRPALADGATQDDLLDHLAPDFDDAERSECPNDFVATEAGGANDDSVTLSFNLRPRVPFAGRQRNAFDQQFAIDALIERQQRGERLARFALPRVNAFRAAPQLVAHFGERAAAIFWTMYCSTQRAAIEESRNIAARARARSAVESYMSTTRAQRRICSVEELERRCYDAFEKRGDARTLTLDAPLYAIIETYVSLVVVEFYLNLVALSMHSADVLGAAVVDAVRDQCFFEHFVPAIISFMRTGLEVQSFTLLPCESVLINEHFPNNSVIKDLGITEQTMTHLCAVIRQYVAAAERSDTPMRLLEATQLSLDDIATLHMPSLLGAVRERASAQEQANAAGRATARLFMERRAQRLQSFRTFV